MSLVEVPPIQGLGVYEFPTDHILVSKTDSNGVIVYANQNFLHAAGYEEAGLLDKPHSLIRHGFMPRSVFALMWETLQKGREFFGYVVNQRSNGDCYWVLAHVVPDFDAQTGAIIGFHSTRRWAPPRARATAAALYARLLEAEAGGRGKKAQVEAGLVELKRILGEAGVSYEQWFFGVASAKASAEA